MSITRTLLVNEAQTGNAASYNIPSTGSINLVAGRVYYLAIRSHVSGGPPDFSLSPGTAITGTAGSWSFVAQTASFFSTTPGRVGLFRYIPSGNENTVVINWNPTDFGTMANCFAFVYEMQGQDTTTPEAQTVATNVAENANPAQIATNLGSAPTAGNSSLCIVGMCDNTETITKDANFTQDAQLAGSGSTADSGAFLASFAATAQQNNTTTGSTTTDDWAGIHAELTAGSTNVTGTAALTIVPSVVTTGTETFTSTAALTIVPSQVASGVETFSGTTPVIVMPSVVASATETFTGTVPLTITPTIEASGSVSGAPVTGTADLTIVPSVVASGTETFTGAATLTIVPSEVTAGAETFTGTGAVVVVPAVVADGSVSGVGITAAGALTIVPVVAGAGVETFSGAGALTLTSSLIGAGAESFAGAAALEPSLSLAAVGTRTILGEPEGTAALGIDVSLVANGYTWVPQGHVPQNYIRWRFRL